MLVSINGNVMGFHQGTSRKSGKEYGFVDFYAESGEAVRLFAPSSMWEHLSKIKRFADVVAVCDIQLYNNAISYSLVKIDEIR